MRNKESSYRYALYRKNRNAKGYSLHSKHMTKSAARKRKKRMLRNFSSGYIKKY